jgi:hypothetical protein
MALCTLSVLDARGVLHEAVRMCIHPVNRGSCLMLDLLIYLSNTTSYYSRQATLLAETDSHMARHLRVRTLGLLIRMSAPQRLCGFGRCYGVS